jgi:hypothetical protein
VACALAFHFAFFEKFLKIFQLFQRLLYVGFSFVLRKRNVESPSLLSHPH